MGLVSKLKAESKLQNDIATQRVETPPAYEELPYEKKNDIADDIRRKIKNCHSVNKLENIISDDALENVITKALRITPDQLKNVVNLESNDLLTDIYQLALYDVIILADDSGSMYGSDRIEELKVVSSIIAQVVTLFDDDGISIRFLNEDPTDPRKPNVSIIDNLTDQKEIESLIEHISFNGSTPLGRSLYNKIIKPFLLNRTLKEFKKPILVIILTDGVADDESKVESTLAEVLAFLKKHGLGNGCVFQVAQIGNEKSAQAFLARIDKNGGTKAASKSNQRFATIKKLFKNDDTRGEIETTSGYGHLIDCTSGYDLESAEVLKAHGFELTSFMWILKLLLGAIDATYDGLDEA
jgi:Mg-chelatase subunit ChlD